MLIFLLSFIMAQNCATYDINQDGFTYRDDLYLALDYQFGYHGTMANNVGLVNVYTDCYIDPVIIYHDGSVTGGDTFYIEIDAMPETIEMQIEMCESPCTNYLSLDYEITNEIAVIYAIEVDDPVVVTSYLLVTDPVYVYEWRLPFTIEVIP